MEVAFAVVGGVLGLAWSRAKHRDLATAVIVGAIVGWFLYTGLFGSGDLACLANRC